jgi:hypothetical protein
MAVPQEYEIFADAECKKRLPVNEITDTFEFVRFASLAELGDDSTSLKPLVLPADVVAPEYVELYRKNGPPIPDEALRGGVPLSTTWRNFVRPRVPNIDVIDIDNVEEFIADPTLIRHRDGPVRLSASNVAELLQEGQTRIEVASDRDYDAIEVRARTAPPSTLKAWT